MIQASSSDSSSKPVDLTPHQFRAFRDPFMSALSGFTETGGGNAAGPTVAPITPMEQRGVSQIWENAFGGGSNAAGDALNSTLRGDFLSPGSNPFLRDTIDLALQPINRNQEREERVDRATFTNAGQRIQGNSAFTNERMRDIESGDRMAGLISSQIAGENLRNERANQMNAIGQSNARLKSQMEAISAIALPRLIKDLGIERGLAEFNSRMGRVRDALQIGAGVTSPVIGQESKSSSFGFGLGPSLLGT